MRTFVKKCLVQNTQNAVKNMQKHSDEFYCAAIHSVYPNAYNIRQPYVLGRISPVFICDTISGPVVCKFNDSNIINRNYYISELLNLVDVPVPQTMPHSFCGAHFESYNYCPDKTLYEHIRSGLSDTQIFRIYQQVFEIQKNIMQINPRDIKLDWGKFAHETFLVNQRAVLPPVLAEIYGVIYKTLSCGGQMFLQHNDLWKKNMLVDNNFNLTRLVDLDMIAVSNVNFSATQMLCRYPLNNYDELIECYEDTLAVKLNKPAIYSGMRAFNMLHVLTNACYRGRNSVSARR